MLFSRSDRRILLDYGMLPTTPPQVPRPAPPVEATLLTHAHLDHSGMIPWVTRRCGCPVWATEATAAVSHILASDSQKIADAEGYDAPFSPSDVDHARELYDLMEFGEVREWDGVEVEVRDCPAIRWLKDGGREIVPYYCQHCHYVSTALADQGRRYIDLLRAHIEKEDHCLFTMANRAFSEEDQRRLLAQFEQVEAELMGAGAHERYVEMANRLAQQLGVEQQAGVGSGHGCSHGR